MTKEEIAKELNRKLTKQELFLYDMMSVKENYKVEIQKNKNSFIFVNKMLNK